MRKKKKKWRISRSTAERSGLDEWPAAVKFLGRGTPPCLQIRVTKLISKGVSNFGIS